MDTATTLSTIAAQASHRAARMVAGLSEDEKAQLLAALSADEARELEQILREAQGQDAAD